MLMLNRLMIHTDFIYVLRDLYRNVVSTVDLGCRLDLKQIALYARNAEYNPKVWCYGYLFQTSLKYSCCNLVFSQSITLFAHFQLITKNNDNCRWDWQFYLLSSPLLQSLWEYVSRGQQHFFSAQEKLSALELRGDNEYMWVWDNNYIVSLFSETL